MRNIGKSLVNKLYSFKKSLCTPIAIAGIGLASYFVTPPLYAQRTTETEIFDSEATISKSNIRDPTEKWNVVSGQMEAEDFGTSSGDERLHWNDKLVDITNKNACLVVTITKAEWGASDTTGIIFAGDPVGGTFWEFEINAHPGVAEQQWGIRRQSPGLNSTYADGTTTTLINPGGTNTLEVSYSGGQYNFKINGTALPINPTYLAKIPALNGLAGMKLRDSDYGDGDPIKKAYYDNYAITQDSGAGGGANTRVTEYPLKGGGAGALIHHIPEIFLRGDSNLDQTINLADAVYTLNGLYRGYTVNNCKDGADANDDGKVDLSDAVYTLYNRYVNPEGYKIPPPNIGGPGIDLTYDQLGCPEGLNDIW